MEKIQLGSIEPVPSPGNPDYLFLDLFEKYMNRVADKYNLSEATETNGILSNKVDLTLLSSGERRGFIDWLNDSFYTRISIENALRRGMSVKGISAKNIITNKVVYSVRIA